MEGPLIAPNRQPSISVIGCGATGSWVGVLLAQMGMAKTTTIIDFDVVEDHNVMNQAYRAQHIGLKKVDALSSIMASAHPKSLYPQKSDVKAPVPYWNYGHYVFLLTDTLESRKEIASTIIDTGQIATVIETRLDKECIRVYVFDENSYHYWLRTLPAKEPVREGECNATWPTPVAPMMLASLAVNTMVQIVNENNVPDITIVGLHPYEVIKQQYRRGV